MTGSPGDADPTVRSLFKVNDTFQLAEGDVEYRVAYDGTTKANFEKLQRQLAPQGLAPWLSGDKDDCVLTVRKLQLPPPQRSRIPVILGLLTLASVAVFGVFEGLIYPALSTGVSWYAAMLVYSVAVGLVIAAHELAHRASSKRAGLSPATPYFIPGIPLVTYYLPIVGIVSSQRMPSVNRDRFFDFMLVGPLAGLAVTVALFVVGQLTSVVGTMPSATCIHVNSSLVSACQVNPNAIQYALGYALQSMTPAAPSGFTRLSPLIDAAMVGFLFSFVSLLPLAFFDGGYMSATVFSSAGAKVATYLGVLALIVIDTPNYWALAIVVLLMAARPVNVQVYDDVSPVSRAKKVLFLAAIAVGFLCLSIPTNFAGIPLG